MPKLHLMCFTRITFER